MTIYNTKTGGFEGLHETLARKEARIKELEDELYRLVCYIENGAVYSLEEAKLLLDDYEPTEAQQGLVPIPDGYAEQ